MNEFVLFEWEEMGKVYIYMGGGGLGKERKRSGKDNKKKYWRAAEQMRCEISELKSFGCNTSNAGRGCEIVV